MKIEWKDIPGYEGLYKVSSNGRVRRVSENRERELKLQKLPNGRLKVDLSKENVAKGFQVHTLVAMAFLGHSPCGHSRVIDHIDNNYLNNKVSNLQITSCRVNNSKDKWRKNPSSRHTGVYKRKNGKFQSQIYVGGRIKYLGTYESEIEASRAYQSALSAI